MNGGTGQGTSRYAARITLSRADESDVARLVLPDLGPGDERRYPVVEEAVEDGTAVVPETTDPPIPDGQVLAYDGAVYRLDREVTRSTEGSVYEVVVEATGSSTGDDGDDTVAFQDLPAVDRHTLAGEGYDRSPRLGVVVSVAYTDAEVAASALVPDPERPVIVWPDGTTGRFVVRDSREASVATYRYTATRIAPSLSAYGATVRDRRLVDLSGVTPGEREVLDAARDDGEYTVDRGASAPDAVERLADRLRGRETVYGRTAERADGTYLVRYRGGDWLLGLAVHSEQFGTTGG